MPPVARTEAPQNIDTALNKGAVAKFLARFPDAETAVDDHDLIASRMEIYQTKEKVAKGMVDTLKARLKAGRGVELPKASLDAISAHIETIAVNDPDKFNELKAKLETEQANRRGINDYYADLERRGGKEAFQQGRAQWDSHKADLGVYEEYGSRKGKVKKFGLALASFVSQEKKDKLNNINEAKGRVERVHRGPVNIKNIPSIIKATEDSFQAFDHFEELRAQLDEARGEVMGEMVQVGDVKTKITEIWTKNFDTLVAEGKLSSFDKAQKMIEQLEADDETGTSPDPAELDKMKARVNQAAEALAQAEVRKAVEGLNVSGDGQLTKLEKAIEVLARRETLGEKKGEEVKEFLISTLEGVVGGLGSTHEDTVKKMICGRLLIKLRSN